MKVRLAGTLLGVALGVVAAEAAGFAPGTFWSSVEQGNIDAIRHAVRQDPNRLETRATEADSVLAAGDTPLIVAVRAASTRSVGALLDLGANPNAQGAGGARPIHYAVSDPNALQPVLARDRARCLQLLLDHDADANTTDRVGWSPLHWAIDGLAPASSIELLLRHGADPNRVADVYGAGGSSPLHMLLARALRRDTPQDVLEWSTPVVDILLRYGARADLGRADGHSAVQMARDLGLVLRGPEADRELLEIKRSVEAAFAKPSPRFIPPRAPASTELAAAWAGKVVTRVGQEKLVALTFDDGPHPYGTPAVLKVLAKYGVPATFFVCGGPGAQHPKLLKQIVEAGHVLGNHTVNHPTGAMSRERARDEIEETEQVIEAQGGAPIRLFRPPGGAMNNGLVRHAKEQGYAVVMWSVDPMDWRPGASASSIAGHVLNKAHPGAIILLHDGGGRRSATVGALPRIIEGLLERGYRFVTVPDLLAGAE